jgi:predicted DNA-binding transcriptional regulator AlpA
LIGLIGQPSVQNFSFGASLIREAVDASSTTVESEGLRNHKPAVLFLGDVADMLRVSRSTIERRRRDGTFPIPALPPLDRRPRWSRCEVERFVESGGRMKAPRGRPPRRDTSGNWQARTVKKDKFVRTIETGIHEPEDGSYVLVACKGKRQHKKRMPPGTSERRLRAKLAEMCAELNRDRIRAAKNTLGEDVDRYLDVIRGDVKFIKDREREIRAWIPALVIGRDATASNRKRSRTSCANGATRTRPTLAIASNSSEPPLPSAGRTECLQPGSRKFDEPSPTPKWLDYEVIRNTLAKMRRTATKARLMMIGRIPPLGIVRAVPEDVVPFLDLPEPFCFKRAGKGGVPLMVPLSPDGVAAWKLLIERSGRGHFSQASMNKNWKVAMKTAGEAAVEAAEKAGADVATVEKIRLMYRPVTAIVCGIRTLSACC